MDIYKHILVAIDLHPNCDKKTIERAKIIAKENNAKLSIVHAIEHINAYGVAEAYSAVLDVEEEMIKEAKTELTRIGEQFDIPPASQFIEVGSPKSVIMGKVEELGVDLIVVGSHGRHGMQLLLGSTANAVLHHANCDVLAVRVSDN